MTATTGKHYRLERLRVAGCPMQSACIGAWSGLAGQENRVCAYLGNFCYPVAAGNFLFRWLFCKKGWRFLQVTEMKAAGCPKKRFDCISCSFLCDVVLPTGPGKNEGSIGCNAQSAEGR